MNIAGANPEATPAGQAASECDVIWRGWAAMTVGRTVATTMGWMGAFALGMTMVSEAGAQAPTFRPNPHLYSETADPTADIAAAERLAQHEGKHILLEFGGNWCGDCQLLDFYYHQPPNAELLAQDYVMVHVDIGHIDRNLDVARRYNTPIDHGVPALAVLDAHGKVLYAQQPKEFEHTTPEMLHALLERWKPVGGR